MEVGSGVDLLAFELLIATLRDWFVICQPRVPAVERFGVSMPAVTTRLDMTKQDMRKGRKTGSPVSVVVSGIALNGIVLTEAYLDGESSR